MRTSIFDGHFWCAEAYSYVCVLTPSIIWLALRFCDCILPFMETRSMRSCFFLSIFMSFQSNYYRILLWIYCRVVVEPNSFAKWHNRMNKHRSRIDVKFQSIDQSLSKFNWNCIASRFWKRRTICAFEKEDIGDGVNKSDARKNDWW